MMLFALMTTDRDGALNIRLETRAAHLDYLRSLGGRLAFAGPFSNGEGTPNGSLVVFEADSLAAAEAVADMDPYAKAGLFAHREIRPWSWSVNPPKEQA